MKLQEITGLKKKSSDDGKLLAEGDYVNKKKENSGYERLRTCLFELRVLELFRKDVTGRAFEANDNYFDDVLTGVIINLSSPKLYTRAFSETDILFTNPCISLETLALPKVESKNRFR